VTATAAGRCPTCGKVRYLTRRGARKVARRRSMRTVSAYRCGDFWHLGHLPDRVRTGQDSRDQLTPAHPRGLRRWPT
jgi:hypothetical protein